MRYRAVMALPLEFCRPRTMRKICPAVVSLGDTTDSTPAEWAMEV